MQLKTKIILSWTLMLILAIGALGLRSVSIIHQNLEEKSYVYLHSILSSYMSDTVQYHQELLEQNSLDTVPSYVKLYQDVAMQAADNIPFYLSGWLTIFDSQGKLIYTTSSSDTLFHYAFWETAAQKLAAAEDNDMVHSISGDTLFTGVYFEPWDWYITAAIDQTALDTSTQTLIRTTLLWAVVILLISILYLYWATQKVLLKPIDILRKAANSITSGTYVMQVEVRTTDDLGMLARDMEKMSVRLQEKEQLLLEANRILDQRVQERTAKLREKTRSLEVENEAHKKTEAALKESEAQYRSIIDHSPDAIFINYHDNVLLVNEACLKLFGAQTPDELIGKNIYECFHPSSHEVIRDRIHTLRDHNQPVPTNIEQILRIDGTTVEVEVTAAPFPFGDSRGTHVILRDVTEKLNLEEQLRQSQKMESIGRLAGGVAHDYNNMLSAIIGYTELALEKIDESSPLFMDLQEVLKAANRSASLTRQLLAFSRKQTINPEIVDLNKTLEHTLKMLKKLIGEGIDLAWVPNRKKTSLLIDPTQIDQVLANLCINARDAIDGVGKITIETDTVSINEEYCRTHLDFKPGEFVLLAVSDDGCGMEHEVAEKIFEPFFSLKGEKGTGLGLSTVYGIVKQNKGFIHVYSEKGEGTTIRIYLPKYEGKASPVEKPTDEPIQEGYGQTILLVEDEAAIREMTQSMLERLGYHVLVARTPGEAIRLADKFKQEIALLLTDVVMPEMNGRELTRKLHETYPDLKTLFMSGYTANVIAHHGVLDKGIHFMQKPFSIKELSNKVTAAMSK
jgi:PAS domain S-box-containing protein